MTMNEYTKPLAPGEIREHEVNGVRVLIFHVGIGATTVQVRNRDGITIWARTSAYEHNALANYSAKIAEYTPAAVAATRPGLGPVPTVRPEDGTPDVERDGDADLMTQVDRIAAQVPQEPQAPQFPAGTPEHDAYAAELRGELRKWATGEAPYEYPKNAPIEGMAALRAQFENLLRNCGVPRASALAAFDRIAVRMPARATDCDGDALWQHVCGAVLASTGKDRPPYSCGAFNCFEQSDPSTWRALYVIEGAR